MSPKIDPNPRHKNPKDIFIVFEEEVISIQGNLQGVEENMDDKDNVEANMDSNLGVKVGTTCGTKSNIQSGKNVLF